MGFSLAVFPNKNNKMTIPNHQPSLDHYNFKQFSNSEIKNQG